MSSEVITSWPQVNNSSWLSTHATSHIFHVLCFRQQYLEMQDQPPVSKLLLLGIFTLLHNFRLTPHEDHLMQSLIWSSWIFSFHLMQLRVNWLVSKSERSPSIHYPVSSWLFSFDKRVGNQPFFPAQGDHLSCLITNPSLCRSTCNPLWKWPCEPPSLILPIRPNLSTLTYSDLRSSQGNWK